jgi:hypothetical protein
MPAIVRVRPPCYTQRPPVSINLEISRIKAANGGDELYAHVALPPPGSSVAYGAYLCQSVRQNHFP